MSDKGYCPKCGGDMTWQYVSATPLRFLLFDGNSEKYAWKCGKCGLEIGSSEKEYLRTPPPKKIVLPYECEARKHFRLIFHTGKLLITPNELRFTDPRDSTYSFSLSANQVKQAKIDPYGNITGAISFTLPNGTMYDLGLDKDQQEMVMAAIGLMLK